MIRLSSIPQFSRNARRFKEIIGVLFKYGLAEWIDRTDPEFVKNLFKDRQGLDLGELRLEKRIRLALSELGPTFIKLGQLLSTRPDLIGPDLAGELAKLQADAPADPPETVKALIEAELGKPIGELFLEFSDQPTASASIGQVHRARIESGEVVIKVQHEGIEAVMDADLEILSALADLAEKYSEELALYQPKAMAAELHRTLKKELDFRREARNLKQFRSDFADRDEVVFPQPVAELSSVRVLTMSRLDGFSIANRSRLSGMDRQALARRTAAIFMDMIFHHGFYHADPHPGNIWVLADEALGVLDCGQTGRLDRVARSKLEDMLLAVMGDDIEGLTETLCRLGQVPRDLDRDQLQADLSDFQGEYIAQAVDEIDIGAALNELTDIIHDHHIRLPANISLLLKVLIMLEGTTRTLDRDFNLMELLRPYSLDAVKRRYSPRRILEKMQRSYRDWDNLLGTLPNDLASIMRLVRAGKFDVYLEHRRLDLVVNRMIYGLLTAAVFLGSCLLLSGRIPPLFHGVSIGGAIGVAGAVIMGWKLNRAIHKSGYLK